MACTRYVTSIQELVDGTIGSIRRADLEAHLDTCDDCRALVANLEKIRDAAGALGDMPVPDRAWLQIAGRLRQEGRIHDLPSPAPSSGLGRYTMLAIAAGLILVV